MLITFRCAVHAYDRNRQVITDETLLRTLDGLVDAGMEIADHLSDPLDQLGLVDDAIHLSFDDTSGALTATVRFRCIGKLDDGQLSQLREEVAGQLSDGYGEDGFSMSDHDQIGCVEYVVEWAGKICTSIAAQQIDDGVPVPDLRPHPLLKAAEQGDLARVRELLQDQTLERLPQNRFGATALTLASGAGHTVIVAELLNSRFKIVETAAAMRRAAQRGDVETLSLLLDYGASPDETAADDGASPLMWAANRGNLEAAQLLVARGAMVNWQGARGETPLMYAHSAPLVHFLMAAGADFAMRDAAGQTALDNALNQLEFAQDPKWGWAKGRETWSEVVAALKQYVPAPDRRSY